MRLAMTACALMLATACAEQAADEDASTDQSALGLPATASDLGRWADVDPALLAGEFDAMISERYSERSIDEAVEELEAEGFECLIDRGHNATCSRDVATRVCVHSWTVSLQAEEVNGQRIEDSEGGFSVGCMGDEPEQPGE